MREKFNDIINNVLISNEELVDNSVKIAEEFAIGFFEWCVSQEALDLINDLVLVGEINKATTSKELLEIYKTTLCVS